VSFGFVPWKKEGHPWTVVVAITDGGMNVDDDKAVI